MIPSTIILIPTPGWRTDLIGHDLLRGRVPTATHAEDNCHQVRSPTWETYTGDCPCGARGLILVWQQTAVTAACDRAIRTLSRAEGFFDSFNAERWKVMSPAKTVGVKCRLGHQDYRHKTYVAQAPSPDRCFIGNVVPGLSALASTQAYALDSREYFSILAHALAIVCEARGLGSAVVLP